MKVEIKLTLPNESVNGLTPEDIERKVSTWLSECPKEVQLTVGSGRILKGSEVLPKVRWSDKFIINGRSEYAGVGDCIRLLGSKEELSKNMCNEGVINEIHTSDKDEWKYIVFGGVSMSVNSIEDFTIVNKKEE